MYYPFYPINEEWEYITNSMVPNIEENRYMISNFGRIKDIKRNIIQSVFNVGDGYLSSSFKLNDGSYKKMLLHRLVGMGFVQGDTNLQINHKNGDKVDCSYTNLEWVTPRENLIHALDTGLHKSGAEKSSAHLTNEQVIIIKNDLSNRMTITQILNHIGLDNTDRNRDLIVDIKRGKTYTRVGTDIEYSTEKLCERRLDREIVIKICEYMQEHPHVYYGYYSNIIDLLNIPYNSLEDRHSIKEMIGSIHRKKAYTDISKNYNW